ncbi:hypothetical protein VTK26DRAFT_747 [Humicola hyalothermophila]
MGQEITGPSGQFSTVVGATFALLAAVYFVIKRAYPRPIPGIPYNEEALNSWMGDLPSLLKTQDEGRSVRPWFLSQGAKHNSALTQVFVGPFAKPAVVISDYREVCDILVHRSELDFKRGKKGEVFAGIMPLHRTVFESSDPRYKRSMELVRGLSTPSFLHEVHGPHSWKVAHDLMELWKLKGRLAKGHPFDVATNIIELGLDMSLSAACGLGPNGGDIRRQLTYLQSVAETVAEAISSDYADEPALIPELPMSDKLVSVKTDEESMGRAFMLPWPALFHKVNKLRPSVRRASRILKGFFRTCIDQSVSRMSAGHSPQNALDAIIKRELALAEKGEREPAYHDPLIFDELYGYLIAGHDSFSGSSAWIIRRLVGHPDEQAKVRADLRATYAEAAREGRPPTIAEMAKRAPYLDAFIEETLRLDCPTAQTTMTTRRDTVILGHAVPADTLVYLNMTGPSLTSPSIPVPAHARSETARAQRFAGPDSWDGREPERFVPERWIKRGGAASGSIRFDPSAGPFLTFGTGPRQCWGKRLGYQNLRITFTILIWCLEFSLPEGHVSFEAYDSLVVAPKQSLIRVTEVQ